MRFSFPTEVEVTIERAILRRSLGVTAPAGVLAGDGLVLPEAFFTVEGAGAFATNLFFAPDAGALAEDFFFAAAAPALLDDFFFAAAVAVPPEDFFFAAAAGALAEDFFFAAAVGALADDFFLAAPGLIFLGSIGRIRDGW
jgi:hypothetical protein